MGIKVIITGATGMVGEGVLLECLRRPEVDEVLSVSRKPAGRQHPKLKELLVHDFLEADKFVNDLKGYDACFFCAGVSSVGMVEEHYARLTYDTTLAFASAVLKANPHSVFTYVSGTHTDSTEKGKVMWARVKGKTENALIGMGFKSVYNFRPGFMEPVPGQVQIKPLYKVLGAILLPVFKLFLSEQMLKLETVGLAMVNSVLKGYPKPILEIKDIRTLASS